MARIELNHVTKRWGGFYAVDDLDLLIDDNAFVTLLGPSGCGKTTTLRMIAGLETPTTGRITIDDTVVFDSDLGINVPANKRRVGFLFQNYALWPNMTVFKNIAFGLSNIKEAGLSVTADGELIRNPEAKGEARKLTKEEIDEGYEMNTGVLIADYFKENGLDYEAVPAVLCKNHGPFTWGTDPHNAVHNAVVLEEVAKMAYRTEVINSEVLPAPSELQDKHYFRKHGKNAYYGQ